MTDDGSAGNVPGGISVYDQSAMFRGVLVVGPANVRGVVLIYVGLRQRPLLTTSVRTECASVKVSDSESDLARHIISHMRQ